jgi:putative acetyltransferase
MNITIRHAEPADYASVAAIYASPRAAAGTLQIPIQSVEVWRQRLTTVAPLDRILVAELNGEVVGNLGLHPATNVRRSHAAGMGMGVRDDAQGQGVGTALVKAAVDLADNWLHLLRLELTPGIEVEHLPGRIIAPGFIDLHVHYPQTDVIGSPASGLLPWLENYTFPQEARFADPTTHAPRWPASFAPNCCATA